MDSRGLVSKNTHGKDRCVTITNEDGIRVAAFHPKSKPLVQCDSDQVVLSDPELDP